MDMRILPYLRNLIPVAVLAACFLVTAVVNPNFLDRGNLEVMSIETALLVVAAIGQMMIMVTGNIDISCSSIMALAGFTSALFMKNNPDAGIALPILIALAIGLVLGCANGAIIGYLELPAIIVTLGTMSIYRGVTFIISGSAWIIQKDLAPTGFRSIALGEFAGLTSIVWIAFFLCVAAALFLRFVRVGRTFFAIGSHKRNAELIGIDIRATVLLVYAIGGTLFGLSGLLLASRYNFAQNSLATGYEMTIIASAVIGGTSVNGGRGSIPGVVVGAFLLSFIVNASNVLKISPFWKMAIQGAIILVAVIIDSWLSKKKA